MSWRARDMTTQALIEELPKIAHGHRGFAPVEEMTFLRK